MVFELPKIMIVDDVKRALLEDLGRAGDLSTQSTIEVGKVAEAHLIAREHGTVSGLQHASCSFELVDDGILFRPHLADGSVVQSGDVVATVSGNARSILSAERTALNFLCHLSGIASITAKFVEQVKHTRARICCTRKTIPGLRASQKYAVRCGGGSNHRFGLDDAILIKDNHIAVAGSVTAAFRSAQKFAGHLVKIEIEVDTLDQLEEALDAGSQCVLLDNFSVDALKEAVILNDGRAVLEASGGVRLETAKGISEAGVDYISSSQITMSATTFDIGLDIAVE